MACDLIAEIIHIFLFQTKTIIFFILAPVFQTDDQIDISRILYAGNTEQCLDIDNTDTAQLDEMLCNIRSGSDQCIITYLADLYYVIRNKTMSTLDQLQCRL